MNLLVSQLSKSKFDVDRVIARVNRPSNIDAFEDLGVRAISADQSIGGLDAELPEGVSIALVGRDGKTQMPEPEFRLQRGDHLPFVGPKESVRDAIERCHPDAAPT